MLNKDLSFEESFDREIRLQCLSTDISNLPTARQILTDGLHAWSPAPSKPTFLYLALVAWFRVWVLSAGGVG